MAVNSRYERILAVLVKRETTEGTDAVPTGGANAMQMTNVNLTPMAGDEVSRELIKPYLGHQGVILVGDYIQIEGDIELAGSGVAGTAPAYSAFLRSCGMSEVVTPGVSVEYEPVSGPYDSASMYWIQDGVRHIALGARGSFVISLIPKQIPRIRFSMMGLLGTITDQANPSVDHSAFADPLPVNKANTSLVMHDYTSVAESLSLDIGQKVTPRFLIGEEGMSLGDRQGVGTAVLKADTIANIDWFGISGAHTTDELQAVHGVTAGNIVTLDAPAVQIGRPTMGASDGITNYSLPLMLIPVTGNDELKITFT